MHEDLNLLTGFGERYAIESFPDGDGVLIDLSTGSYFRINRTAVIACEILRDQASVDDAVGNLARQIGISVEQARQVMTMVSNGLSKGLGPEEPIEPLTYASGSDGSSFFLEEGRVLFSVDRARQSVRFRARLDGLKAPMFFYLRSLMPKLVALLDIPVLHAAACRIGRSLVAFSGKSGAGKTTTARAFARAGAALISEDLLVVSLADGESPVVFTSGETFARTWAREEAARLERAPDLEITFSKLREACSGPTAPLDALWLIAATRRGGSEISSRKLSLGEGVAALLGNGFLAASDAPHWRDFLRRSRAVAERTSLTEVTMPDGLERLEDAARRYIVSSAS